MLCVVHPLPCLSVKVLYIILHVLEDLCAAAQDVHIYVDFRTES